jgi:Uncharacterized conserved protein
MCGRYYVEDNIPIEQLAEIIAEVNRKIKDQPVKTSGTVSPTDKALVMAANGIDIMQWGLSGFDGKKVIINSRSEGILEKPMFAKAVRETRCLIPASYYFEWELVGTKKVKNQIKPRGENVLYMAGIYRVEREKPLPVFSIITRDAAPTIKHIHDRMPVILAPDAQREWLSPRADIAAVLKAGLSNMEFKLDAPTQQLNMFSLLQ